MARKISSKTHRNLLEGTAQHGDEHVNEDDCHYSHVSAKHELPHKLSKNMLLFQFEFRKFHQPVNGKVQSLNDFKQAETNLHLDK